MSAETAASTASMKEAQKDTTAPAAVVPSAEAIDEDDEFEEFKQDGACCVRL